MRRAGRWLGGIVLAALLAAFVYPFYWAVIASLTAEAELFEGPAWLPGTLVPDHYRALFLERGFWVPIGNSLLVAGLTTLLCLALGSPCAYAIARLRFRGRALVLGATLAVTMFPQIAIVPPLYMILRRLGLINTYGGLIVPYLAFAMPLAVWLLTSYFRQLPADLEDAAMVDGASRLRAFREVTLPLALPGLAATAILTFVFCWNEFLFALSFTLGPERQTVPVALALFRGRYQVPWGQVLAAAVVSTAPVALLVLMFQRRIVRGLTAGALKG